MKGIERYLGSTNIKATINFKESRNNKIVGKKFKKKTYKFIYDYRKYLKT